MLDKHEAHSDRNENGRNPERREIATDRPVPDRLLADREVPLPGATNAIDGAAFALNQWLDGDVSEAEARRADDKQVDMWKRITSETAERKKVVTPTYVAANIMAALPESRFERRKRMDRRQQQKVEAGVAPVATSHISEGEHGLPLNIVVAIGVGLFAIGLLIGKMI